MPVVWEYRSALLIVATNTPLARTEYDVIAAIGSQSTSTPCAWLVTTQGSGGTTVVQTNDACAVTPSSSVTVIVTGTVSTVVGVPVIVPVRASSVRPAGRADAANVTAPPSGSEPTSCNDTAVPV